MSGKLPKICIIETSNDGATFTFKGLDGSSSSRDQVLTTLNGSTTTGTLVFTSVDDDPDDDANKSSSLVTNVVNKNGTELPENGGVGTKLFYLVGSVLVIGAAVLLVTRKRMRIR